MLRQLAGIYNKRISMCVDKHHYKCCGSCSLTTATLVLGCFYLLYTIGCAVSQQWVSFAIGLVMTLLFVMVLVKPNDIGVRKLIFYLISIGQVIATIALILVFIILMATDGWYDEARDNCYEQSTKHDYDWQDNCDDIDWIKKIIIWTFVCFLIIDLVLCYCVLQILYYGWKEQESLAADQLAYGNNNQGGAQVYNAPYQPVPVNGQYQQPAPVNGQYQQPVAGNAMQ